MNITLARIDDRLIHGQVTTVWSKVANAQRIIICNDEVYNAGHYCVRLRHRE